MARRVETRITLERPARREVALTGVRRRLSVETAILAAALAVAAAHTVAVWPSYHPLSFYDDAHYVLLARNLGDGIGLVDTSRAGNPADTVYPPGYPALLAPLTVVFGDALEPLRLLSVACFLGVIVLTNLWLRDRGERRNVVVAATLLVFAVNPMAATYSSMIMAEMPFLLALTGAVVAALRWERSEQVATRWGAVTVLALTAAIYLKAAGLLLVPGFALYFLLRRRLRHAIACLAGPLVLFAPVLIRNALTGAPVEGAAYGSQISLSRGGLGHVMREAWGAVEQYARTAFGDAVVDSRPFGGTNPVARALLDVLRLAILPLVVLGGLLAGRRRLDPALVAVPIYLVATLAYEYTNERRLILVLPFLVYWAVCGLAGLAGLAANGIRRSSSAAESDRRRRIVVPALAGLLVVAVLIVPVVPQFQRDYRFFTGDTGMNPIETPSLAILRAAGRPEVAVAARHVYAVHLVTRHKAVRRPDCQAPAALWRRFVELRAGFATFGDYRRPPGAINDPCQVRTMDADPERYVSLYRDAAEPTVTYQLVGPGSPFPHLADAIVGGRLVAGPGRAERRTEHPITAGDPSPTYVAVQPTHGNGILRIRFPLADVTQVSVGAAGNPDTPPVRTEISLRTPAGWRSVQRIEARNIGPVGGRSPSDDALPFLLERFPRAIQASGVRIEFSGPGPYEVHDLHVLVRTQA